MQIYFSILLMTALTMSEMLFASCLFLKDSSLRAFTEYLDSVIRWKKWKWRLTKVSAPLVLQVLTVLSISVCSQYNDWHYVLSYVYLRHTEHFRLMRNWHICEGLLSIWECRSQSDIPLSRRVSQHGHTGGPQGIQTMEILSLPST